MFGTICFLLVSLSVVPGMHAELHQCRNKLMKAFASREPLEPSPLEYYAGNTFWRVSATPYELVGKYFTISATNLCKGVSNVTTNLYDDNRNIIFTLTVPYTEGLEGKERRYAFSSLFQASFTFKCTEKLIAHYRCQIAGSGKGPLYAIHAFKRYSWDDVKDELQTCKRRIQEIDQSATAFTEEAYPTWWQ